VHRGYIYIVASWPTDNREICDDERLTSEPSFMMMMMKSPAVEEEEE
jgi:hypothetical protein